MQLWSPGGVLLDKHWRGEEGKGYVLNYRWDTSLLEWVKLEGGTGGLAADVTVLNFPAVYPIDDNGGSITIDGTVAISGTVPISAISLPLPTGAATEATLSAINTKLPASLGQKTSANSFAVVMASDQSPFSVSVSGTVTVEAVDFDIRRLLFSDDSVDVSGSTVAATQSGTWSITDISGTVSLPTGAATETTLAAILSNTNSLAVLGGGTEAAALRVTIANNSTGVLSVDDNGASLTVDGTVAATQSGSWTVTGAVTATLVGTTVAETDVSVTTSSTALKASNANRKRLTIQNHGAGYVRVSLSGTATTTSPIRLVPEVGTWILEGDFLYTGAVSAIGETVTCAVGVIEET